MDLAALMTKVAESVSKQRGVDQDGKKTTKLQIPCIVSTLKKQIYLRREWEFFLFNENLYELKLRSLLIYFFVLECF